MVDDSPDLDCDLLQRAQSGDRDACAALLKRHEASLRAWLRSRIGVRMRGRLDLEDAFQETASGALQSLGAFEYRGEGSFFRWLRSIGERVILKAAERDRKKPMLTLRHEIEARRLSPSGALRRHERFDRLEDAMGRLSPEHREIGMLARIEGQRIKDIAARTGRTPAAVSMLLSRALRNLKDLFGDTESLHLPDRQLGGVRPGVGEDDQ